MPFLWSHPCATNGAESCGWRHASCSAEHQKSFGDWIEDHRRIAVPPDKSPHRKAGERTRISCRAACKTLTSRETRMAARSASSVC